MKIGAGLLAILLAGPSPLAAEMSPPAETGPEGSVEAIRWVMGTALHIVVRDGAEEADRLLERCFGIAQRWDRLLSDYDPSSPLSLLNAAGGEATPIPTALFAYLRRATRDVARTDGAFDPTVGALVDALRGDGRAGAEAALASVGMQRVRLWRQGERSFARLEPAARLDPGADGKGVALDEIARLLREHGVENAFVEFGGSSFLALGSDRDGKGWPVLLVGPDGEPHAPIRLHDEALAVSSTVRHDAASGRPVDVHLLDPRDGRRITRPRTVVVRAPQATDADVLSTALAVEGASGLRWLPRFPGAEALILETGRPPRASEGFGRR